MIDGMLLTVIAGLAGGILRSIIGYLEKEDAEFNFKMFLNSLIRAGIGGVIAGIGLGIAVINIQTFIMVLFACAGFDTVLHEGYKAYKKE
jgi:uncharacterized membrane protein